MTIRAAASRGAGLARSGSTATRQALRCATVRLPTFLAGQPGRQVASRLMAQYVTGFHRRRVAFYQMEVRPADRI